MEFNEALLEKGTNNVNGNVSQNRGLCNLLCINALICGIEIVCSCAFTYIPPLLLKSGFTETAMTIILGIAPFLDMVTVPTLARWSDKCNSRYGRRRPFIAGLSVLLIVSLYLIPYSSAVTLFSADRGLHMFLLALGVIMLDYAYQALFNPCESLLSDIMPTCDRSNQMLGFTIYSACISLGCIIGYLVGAIDWKNLSQYDATNEQLSFGVSSILFLICLVLTLTAAKENPTLNSSRVNYISSCMLNSFDKSGASLGEEGDRGMRKHSIEGVSENGMVYSRNVTVLERGLYRRQHSIKKHFTVGLSFSSIFSLFKNVWKLTLVALCIPLKLLQIPLVWFNQLQASPSVLQRLFLAELSGWTAILCHSMFFTNFVGQYINEGLPSASEHSSQSILYNQGVQMGSWALFLQSTIACIYAFTVQQHLVLALGPRAVFLMGIATFGICMILTTMSPSILVLYFITALSGLGFAALTTTPNMLVTIYNTDRQFYMWDTESENANLATPNGMGTDIALLDMAYYLSQIILSIFLGPIIKVTNSSLSYIVVSAIACCFAFYFSLRVVFTRQQLLSLRDGKF